MKSEALKHLQAEVGVTADGAFGPNTARAIHAAFNFTPEESAHLMGQAHHESMGFQITEESLYYRAETMMRVWPSRYPDLASTEGLARNPEALANHTYANRMGNGGPDTGDGWRYRGRGFIQLTGTNNYRLFSEFMSKPELMDDPDPVADELAFQSAIWFFMHNDLTNIARKGVTDEQIRVITKRVNGGYHGLDDRVRWTKKIYGWLQ